MSGGSLEPRHLVHFIITDELNSIDVGRGASAAVNKYSFLQRCLRLQARCRFARVQSCVVEGRAPPILARQPHKSTQNM